MIFYEDQYMNEVKTKSKVQKSYNLIYYLKRYGFVAIALFFNKRDMAGK